MGGHGGLNILPQKKWNVYNWDNRIKVSKDEAKVRKELNKKSKFLKEKKFNDKISKIKKNEENDDVREVHSEDENRKYVNKIFKDIVELEKREKKVKVNQFFEKMRTIVNKEEHIKLFECEEQQEKERNTNENNNIVKDQTFKDIIDKHLHPWYIKKRTEDYSNQLNSNDSKILKGRLIYDIKNDHNFYQVIHQKSLKKEENESFLKHKKLKKHKKKKKNNDKSPEVSLEKLREERLEREMKEKKRIEIFLQKNNINN